MAQVVNVKAPDLAEAAATVAQHMQTAAKPPTAIGTCVSWVIHERPSAN
jgi:hypothetical protein